MNANPSSAKGMKPGDNIIVPSQKKETHKKPKSVDSPKDTFSHEKTPKENGNAEKVIEPSNTSPGDIHHLVKKGDNLSSIAHKYSVTVIELRELNGLKKSAKLRNGQRLLVKSAGPKIYTVKK
jgi:LysM repeat protein